MIRCQLSEDAIDVSGVCQIARESGKIFPGTRAEAELLDASRKRREVQEKVRHTILTSYYNQRKERLV